MITTRQSRTLYMLLLKHDIKHHLDFIQKERKFKNVNFYFIKENKNAETCVRVFFFRKQNKNCHVLLLPWHHFWHHHNITQTARVWRFGHRSMWRSVSHQVTHRHPSPENKNRCETLMNPRCLHQSAAASEQTNQSRVFIPFPHAQPASSAASSQGDSKPLPCCRKLRSTGSDRLWLHTNKWEVRSETQTGNTDNKDGKKF